jgi:hypothetical protein
MTYRSYLRSSQLAAGRLEKEGGLVVTFAEFRKANARSICTRSCSQHPDNRGHSHHNREYQCTSGRPHRSTLSVQIQSVVAGPNHPVGHQGCMGFGVSARVDLNHEYRWGQPGAVKACVQIYPQDPYLGAHRGGEALSPTRFTSSRAFGSDHGLA